VAKKEHLITKAMEEIYRFIETSYEIWCPRQRSCMEIDLAGGGAVEAVVAKH
jgi:hypothetical protein